MKELVLFLAKHLVNHPEAVEVKETQGDTASVLELKVAILRTITRMQPWPQVVERAVGSYRVEPRDTSRRKRRALPVRTMSYLQRQRCHGIGLDPEAPGLHPEIVGDTI